MRIAALSVDQRSASVELRERIAIGADRFEATAARFRAAYPEGELVVVSTCNRTELYAAGPEAAASPDPDGLGRVVADACGVAQSEVAAVARPLEQRDAARHLFRVATGLESMVVGEPQVLGQIKRAYHAADDAGLVGSALHQLFQEAIAAAKDARQRTGIGAGQASVGSAAAGFAQQIFERFDDKVVVGLGAGEMAKLTLRHLRALGPARLSVMNRSPERARALADALPPAAVRAWDELDAALVEADIVLTSTGASAPLLTAERFRPLIRRRNGRPLFLIDIALPRDVEPAVGELPDVYLYNIDDLQEVVRTTHRRRTDEIEACERILDAAATHAVAAIEQHDVRRLIRRLREKLHALGRAESERTRRKIAADPQRAAELVDQHTHRLINKVLHMPLQRLDHREDEATLRFYAQALRALFELEDAASGEDPDPGDDAGDVASDAEATGQRA